MTLPIVLRPIDRANDGEMNLVLDSWVRSGEKSRLGEVAPKTVFRQGHMRVIVRLLRECEVTVAELPDVPGLAIGWACWDSDATHYVYVKTAYRRQGVANALLSGKPNPCSHWTYRADRVASFRARFRFDPWIALGGK